MKKLVLVAFVFVGVLVMWLVTATPVQAGYIESWNGNGGSLPSFMYTPVTQVPAQDEDNETPEVVIEAEECGEYQDSGPHPCPGGRNGEGSFGIGIPAPDPKRMGQNK